MVTAFLIGVLVSGINQTIKLIMRFFGITKETAKKVVFFIMFILVLLFTLAQEYNLVSWETLTHFGAIFTTAVGFYELVLNKTGLDGWMKDSLEINRGE